MTQPTGNFTRKALSGKRVNLRDVARVAGVTHTTVAMALRNDRRISERTRERVVQIAKDMGYRADPVVAALMKQAKAGKKLSSESKLAILGPTGNYNAIMTSSFSYTRKVAESMHQRAKELGYAGIDVFEPEKPSDSLAQPARVIAYRGIKGILLPPFMEGVIDVGRNYAFDYKDFALVATGHSQVFPGIHRIAHDQYRIAYDMTKAVLEKGYRRIGITLQEEFERRTGWRYTGGFHGALQHTDDAWLNRKAILYRNRIPVDQWNEKIVEWITSNRIECLITQDSSDYNRLIDAGFKTPQDIGLALITLSGGENHPVEKTSGMFHDPVEIGRSAVDLLTAQINRNEFGPPPFPKTILTKPKWQAGTTLRQL